MKIYHTETQEDYDALMVELERQGCKWYNGVQMTKNLIIGGFTKNTLM